MCVPAGPGSNGRTGTSATTGGIEDVIAHLPLQWTIFRSATRNSTLSA